MVVNSLIEESIVPFLVAIMQINCMKISYQF